MRRAPTKRIAVVAVVLLAVLLYLVARLDIYYAQSRADRPPASETRP